MENVAARAPAATSDAFTSAYTSSSNNNIINVNVDITGWTDLWLVNDFDNDKFRLWQVQPKYAQWLGAWGNARIVGSSGNILSYADNGFCSAYDHESVSCWADAYGKNLRDPIKIGSRSYNKGVLFQGNSVWHVSLPSGNRHRRFIAEAGRWAGQNNAQIRFRVVRHADHKLWLREMWARTVMAFPDKLEEMEFERNSGAWEDKWSSVSGLATNYALRTSSIRGYQNVAITRARSATTEAQLHSVRGLYHASQITQKKLSFLTPGQSLDWFSSIDTKISQTQEMKQLYKDCYKNYDRDMATLRRMKSNYDIAFSTATSNTDGWAVVNAANSLYEDAYNFTMQWPPWLYDDIDTPSRRVVTVSNVAEYRKAIANPSVGDRIVLKDGIYHNAGSLFPASYPPANNRSPVYPLVIVAENPGKVHFTGSCKVETRGVANIIFRGIVIRDSNANFELTRNSRDIRVSHVALIGTKDEFNINRNSASIRFDHSYMGNGKERVVRRLYTEDGGDLGLGRNQFDHLFLGQRRRSFQNGAELLRNIDPVSFYNNFIDKYVGEAAEVAKCGPGCHLINNTLSRHQTDGQFPGRCVENGVIEGNYYLSGARIRTGGYDNKKVVNNYVDGSYMLIGSSSYPVAFLNSVNFSGNTFYQATLGTNSEVGDPRHQFRTVMSNNLFLNSKFSDKANDQSTWKGGNNIASPSVPSGLPSSLWRSVPSIVNGIKIDEYGIARPSSNGNSGFQRTDPPFTNFDSRVGPAYLPVSVRINRNLASEYSFDKRLNPSLAYHVPSDWGAFAWHLDMYSLGGTSRIDLYSAGGQGVSGKSSDRCLDTRTTAMGGNGFTVKGQASAPQKLNGFTISGWFNANKGSRLGNNAVLVSARSTKNDNTYAFEVRGGPSPGAISLVVRSGSSYYTWTSPAVYTDQNKWVFFAVVFEQDEPYVAFYKGTNTAQVSRVMKQAARVGEIPFNESPVITIGATSNGSRAFAGLMDNVRLWFSEHGPNRVDDPIDRHAEITLEELEYLRQSDLGNFVPSDPTKN